MSVTFDPAWPVPYRTAPPIDLGRLYRQALFMGTRQPPNMVTANGGHYFPKPRPYLRRSQARTMSRLRSRRDARKRPSSRRRDAAGALGRRSATRAGRAYAVPLTRRPRCSIRRCPRYPMPGQKTCKRHAPPPLVDRILNPIVGGVVGGVLDGLLKSLRSKR